MDIRVSTGDKTTQKNHCYKYRGNKIITYRYNIKLVNLILYQHRTKFLVIFCWVFVFNVKILSLIDTIWHIILGRFIYFTYTFYHITRTFYHVARTFWHVARTFIQISLNLRKKSLKILNFNHFYVVHNPTEFIPERFDPVWFSEVYIVGRWGVVNWGNQIVHNSNKICFYSIKLSFYIT